MCMKKYLDTKEVKWYRLLILALVAYTVKNILVGADVDEGYGIMVGYRLATGDRLLMDMWEPHQTSAIFTALPIRLFLLCTGGNVDFLNIYLRIVFFALHGLISWVLYKALDTCVPQLGKVASALMAAFFYVSSPKCIFIPEYSNLHIWFLSLLCVSLLWYCGAESPLKGKNWLLLMAGFWMTCDVLAYPSMVLLFPVCVLFLMVKEKGRAWKVCGLFTLPCVISALALVAYISSYMSWEQILQVLPHILGDGSHEVTFGEKMSLWGEALMTGAIVCTVAGLLAVAATWVCVKMLEKRGRAQDRKVWFLFFFVVALVDAQVITWLFGQYNATYLQLQYLMIPLLGIYAYTQNKNKTQAKEGLWIVILALISYIAVIVLSNWQPMNLNTYLVLGVVGGMLGLWNYFSRIGEHNARKLVQGLMLILVLGNAFGYSYRIIGGDEGYSTVLDIRGYNHDSVRKGILTNYMTSYRYNKNLEIWEEAVPAGSKLMYVGMSQFYYMLGDCVVACPSTISTPTYDESLLEYWEMNPERYPDVIALESWFGDVGEAADGFLMKWIEEEFQATEIIEYPYITVYKRE